MNHAEAHRLPLLKQIGVNLNEFRFKSQEERQEIINFCREHKEVRCFFCGRIIFCGTLGKGTHIQAKCHFHGCKKMNVISIV